MRSNTAMDPSSVAKPARIAWDGNMYTEAEMVESSVGKPASSHDASAAADSSVVQPAANVGDEIVLAFYNITWNEKELTGPKKKDHEKPTK